MNERLITDLLAAYRACPADADQLRRQRIVLADALEEAGDVRTEEVKLDPVESWEEPASSQLTYLTMLVNYDDLDDDGLPQVLANPLYQPDLDAYGFAARREEIARVRILQMFPGAIYGPSPLRSLYSTWRAMEDIRAAALARLR